jgi:hypothetical protein
MPIVDANPMTTIWMSVRHFYNTLCVLQAGIGTDKWRCSHAPPMSRTTLTQESTGCECDNGFGLCTCEVLCLSTSDRSLTARHRCQPQLRITERAHLCAERGNAASAGASAKTTHCESPSTQPHSSVLWAHRHLPLAAPATPNERSCARRRGSSQCLSA